METTKGDAAAPCSLLTLGKRNSMVSVKWVAEEGWAGSPPSICSATRLSFAQKALLRCLHEERAADQFPLEVLLCVVQFPCISFPWPPELANIHSVLRDYVCHINYLFS